MAIREIGASVTMDASTFKKEMSAVNSNLAGLQSELKATTAEFAENASSTEALSAKQKILSEQEAQQKAKVEALTKAYAEQTAATGENSVEADKLRKQLNNARADYAKATTAAKDNAKALKESKTVSGQLAQAKEKLSKATEGVRKAMDKAKPAAEALGKVFSATGKATAALTTAGAAAAVGLGTMAVKGLSTLVDYAKEAATAVDAKGKLIDQRFSTLAANMTALDAGAAGAKAALGNLLLPALESLSGAGAELLQGFTADLNAAEGDVKKMGQVCANYMARAARVIRDELPGLVSLGGDILSALASGLRDALPVILQSAGKILDTLMDGLAEAAPEMGDGAAMIINMLLKFLLQNAPQLLTAGVQILSSLVGGISSNLPSLIPVAIEAVQALLQALVSNAPQLLVGGATLVLTLVEGLIDHIPDLLAAIPQLIGDFVSGFSSSPALDNLVAIGERIMQKIWDGLKAVWESISGWFSEKLGALGDFLGIGGGGGSGHAGGLNYVPYDGYQATLHKGERVLTAAENASGAWGGGSRVVNITLNTREASRSQVDYIIRKADTELGAVI